MTQSGPHESCRLRLSATEQATNSLETGELKILKLNDIAESGFCFILLVFLPDWVLLYKVFFTFFIILCDN